jgi:putative transcriptional regulator
MNDKDFSELLAIVKEAGQIKSVPRKTARAPKKQKIPVKAIRSQLHVSQNDFALMFGISVQLLENWERGISEPDGPAKALLTVAAKNPQAVLDALHT